MSPHNIDHILTGKVITLDAAGSIAEAVAVTKRVFAVSFARPAGAPLPRLRPCLRMSRYR